jgi:MEMO1 family protein
MLVCEEIESCGTLFEINDIPHLEEHAIEVQLPFMKSVFSLTPLLIPMISDGNEVAAILAVARALGSCFRQREGYDVDCCFQQSILFHS